MGIFSKRKPLPAKDRPVPTMVRGFAAAETSRLLAGWKWDGGFNASAIGSTLPTIRARSREMAKNSPHFKRWIDLRVTNIVGEGFALKSTPHDGDPGSGTATLDTDAARRIEYHFWRWATMPEWCDSQGRMTVAQIDRLLAETQARDGEYFLLVDLAAQNPYGVSLRVIRPDACPADYNVHRLPNGNTVRCGVELVPSTWRPVAYYFYTEPLANGQETHRGTLRRVERESTRYRVIHGFRQHDENQVRGVPEAYAALVKFKMLEELDVAELTAARDEACSFRTYYAPKGDEEAIADLTAKENAESANALVAEKSPGQAEIIPIGWKAEIHTPQHPNAVYAPFKVSMLRDLASGLGVEHSTFSNDWTGVSYSSVRQGVIAERDLWKVLQDEMVAQCKAPVFIAWLGSFLSLAVSGSLPASKFAKFAEHEFRPRRWAWVDPSSEMNAAQTAVKYRWRTNAQIASDLGTDFYDNVEEENRATAALSAGSDKTVPVLNGAQITAALEIVQSYAIGAIGQEAATQLLIASGVPMDVAESMVKNQKVNIEKPA